MSERSGFATIQKHSRPIDVNVFPRPRRADTGRSGEVSVTARDRDDLGGSITNYSVDMLTRWQTWHRRWAALAAILGFAMASIYVTVMISEGNNAVDEVAPWVLVMLVPAFLSLSAWSIDADWRARVLLLGAAIVFLAIGVLSIFSLGIGFLLAGLVALFAANELPRATR